MNCTIQGCPGVYETREIVHTVRSHGSLRVIDHVPAEVCSICGDTLLTPETIRAIEGILSIPGSPASSVPLYEYADAA